LYDRSEYFESIWLFYYLGAEAILNAIGCAFIITLRAAVYPNMVFWSKLFSAILTITFGIIMGKFYGMFGLVIALVVGTTLRAVLLTWHCWTLYRQFRIGGNQIT
jgi:O-antigen/teichoic acid export membrane protein